MSKEKSPRKREGFDGQRLIVIPKKIVSEFLVKDPVTRQIYITDIGFYPKAMFHYAERAHGISQHIIIYCIEGYGWIEINKKRIRISPSQFIAIPAHTPHRYGADEQNPWSIYWAHFKGESSAFIANLIVKNSDNYRPQLTFNEDRIGLFDDIYYNLENGYGDDTLRYVNMIFYHFLSSVIYEDKFNRIKKTVKTDMVDTAIKLMQDKIQQTISLKQMADFSSLSVTHFSSLFKKKRGIPQLNISITLKYKKLVSTLYLPLWPSKNSRVAWALMISIISHACLPA
nr:AraC family ligand binding domain-containing protein [Mucilaginibacter sp.]